MQDFDLDAPLITFADYLWSSRYAVEGVQIFGGIGSGKSSGSGRTLALKYLEAGFGGLVLTAKPDERKVWQEYCELTGRLNDFIVIEPSGKNFFNFIAYESANGEKSLTENIVQLLKTVIQASEDKGGNRGFGGDAFWEGALDQLLFHLIDLCQLAYGETSIRRLYHIVLTLPKPKDKSGHSESRPASEDYFKIALGLARKKAELREAEWKVGKSIPDFDVLPKDMQWAEVLEHVPEMRLYNYLDNFFYDTFINLAEKTRSVIEFSFSTFLFRLLRDPIFSLFCNNPSNVLPEDCERGKIILINLPVKTYHKIGRDCQIMFKYIWQRAMEKRRITKTTRPVFLWADEAQHFLHEHDAEFQATARSSRVATVYISQNIPNYYANMGGSHSEYRVKSFLGTLNTKIFHANSDVDTNRYASELIGDGYYEALTTSSNISKGSISSGKSRGDKIERIMPPEDFAKLKTGGDLNKGVVWGILHQQGNAIATEGNFLKVTFNQNLNS